MGRDGIVCRLLSDYLRKYIELKNGPLSHDTIRRVMGMISPEILQQLYGKWQERLNQNDGELWKKSFVLMRKLCDQTNAKRKKLARSTNYWIMQADNVELFAPSLIGICTWLDEHPEIDINPIELEAAQCIVFAEERREELE